MWWPSVSDSTSPGGTLGVLVLATLIAGILYGITVLQSVQYADKFYNDPSLLKFMVAVLWAFETITVISEAHALYTYSVSYSGTLFALVPLPWSLQLDRAFSYAVIYGVQMFYAVRIRQLGRRYWYFPVLTGLLATGAIAATVQGYTIGDPNVPSWINILSTTSAGLQIGVDVLIAGALYWFSRNRAGNLKKRALVKHTLVSAINRGVISTLLQAMITVSYFALRPRMIWLAFQMANNKVHAMSLLSTLNTRSSVDGVGHDPEIVDARLRYRVERELANSLVLAWVQSDGNSEFQSRTESPPIIPDLGHGLMSSQSSWFAKSEEGGLARYAPSYHARSTTAVESQSAA
ncbi:hypothetical protein DICSQDRAFT_168282 [Dichomitus squalens LYAD-421 SS1]|uniref:uncharacterized protein n=1 Tax=Dichomitus squalens (strain LYAD-421) TaxID=732165 RepID=UPI0004410B1D|nr:uncharacterized protein DICSQDRAFT_168282 [Dichomitus squalens LYAD-421 SS1]EJF63397.1 hypothetical protein DICSQDRAFT_168282 [Dichomitus squalens LYAD-421 SS1]